MLERQKHNYAALGAALLLAALLPAHGQDKDQSKADLILTNARIFTGYQPDHKDAISKPQMAESLVCAQGKIIFVGKAQGALAYKSTATQVCDLGGRLVLPGFHDCHVHLCEGGLERNSCQLNGVKSKEAALAKLKTYAASSALRIAKSQGGGSDNSNNNNHKWLIACGLPLPAVSDSQFTCRDIDSIEKRRPVVIYAEDAHSLWANSRALELAKIDASTKTPAAGIIERDKNGRPCGAFREAAMDLVDQIVPVAPLDERVAALQKVVALANSLGITSIQDAHCKEPFLQTYFELARHNQLNLRVVAALHVGHNFGEKDFDHLIQLRQKYSTGNLHATSAKIFADGVIETHTAALLQPYRNQTADDKNQKDIISNGTLNYSPEELKRIVLALDQRDFQVHIHAIGDRAVRCALDAFAGLDKNARRDHRHQIAHLELVQKADQSRFKDLGVIANFQPYWAFNDPYMLKLTAPALGDQRMKLIYPIGSLIRSSAHVAAGSDWTVSTLNPLKAMQVAITRQEPGRPFSDVLLKDERVSLKQILAAYTTGGAYANHSEGSTGSLEVGKAADLIVLDQDIFTVQPTQIGLTKVLKTYVDGRLVYDRSKAGDAAINE